VYHVGSPWMFEGNKFFPDTGIPILKRARSRVTLAVCEPDPFVVAMVIEKLLIISEEDIHTPIKINSLEIVKS
jgi:hypothetical protein